MWIGYASLKNTLIVPLKRLITPVANKTLYSELGTHILPQSWFLRRSRIIQFPHSTYSCLLSVNQHNLEGRVESRLNQIFWSNKRVMHRPVISISVCLYPSVLYPFSVLQPMITRYQLWVKYENLHLEITSPLSSTPIIPNNLSFSSSLGYKEVD